MAITLGPKRGLIINAAFDEIYDAQLRTLLRAIDQSTPVWSVLNEVLTAPPGSPANGDAYIVAVGGSGAWAGRDGFMAVWTTDNPGTPGGLWEFYEPFDGVIAYSVNSDAFAYSVGGVWTPLATGGGGSSTLAADTDVTLTSPADGDLLTFETSSSKWKNKPLSFLAGGKYAADIGDGVSLSIGVNHGLHTKDIIVGVYDVSTGDQEPQTTTYEIVDIDNINVLFGTAPLTSSKRVVILAIGQTFTSTAVAGVSNKTASYTLVLADAGFIIRMNVAGANNLTVPPNSSEAFPVGSVVSIRQIGAGITTLVAGAGVTLNSPATLAIARQHGTVQIVKVATDTWDVMGDLT